MSALRSAHLHRHTARAAETWFVPTRSFISVSSNWTKEISLKDHLQLNFEQEVHLDSSIGSRNERFLPSDEPHNIHKRYYVNLIKSESRGWGRNDLFICLMYSFGEMSIERGTALCLMLRVLLSLEQLSTEWLCVICSSRSRRNLRSIPPFISSIEQFTSAVTSNSLAVTRDDSIFELRSMFEERREIFE